MKIGDNCPDFKLLNQFSEEISNSQYLGKSNLVIYFYPKDNTKVCTAQACSFQDDMAEFKNLDAVVLGISSDSTESHKSFAKKNKIQFDLLSDLKGKVRKLFDVKANLFGLIPGRETYIIDKNGKVRGTYNAISESSQHIEFAKKILSKIE
jgi:peroxiredoxin Q/BCP